MVSTRSLWIVRFASRKEASIYPVIPTAPAIYLISFPFTRFVTHPPTFHSRKYATATFCSRKCSRLSFFSGYCCLTFHLQCCLLSFTPSLIQATSPLSVPLPHKSMNLIGGEGGRGEGEGGLWRAPFKLSVSHSPQARSFFVFLCTFFLKNP
jgi:hypothetical protein